MKQENKKILEVRSAKHITGIDNYMSSEGVGTFEDYEDAGFIPVVKEEEGAF